MREFGGVILIVRALDVPTIRNGSKIMAVCVRHSVILTGYKMKWGTPQVDWLHRLEFSINTY